VTARSLLRTLAVAAALGCAASRAHAAATFNIINNDPAGVGFNDPTAAAPVGGNAGTTVGQQRMLAFQFAANQWGARITSGITINVVATFGALSCSASSGVLGSAGPGGIVRFGGAAPGVPANTWVSMAEGEKIANADVNAPGAADISASFNGNIGTTGCLNGLSWYYGFDSNPPSGALDFVTVLMHELTHGLGFLTFVNLTTGAENGGFDDVYEVYLRDNVTAPNTWTSMTNAQRVASAVNTNQVVWTGAQVTALPITSGQDGSSRKLVYTPNPLQGGSSVSHWTQAQSNGSTCVTCTDLLPIDLMRPSYTVPTHRGAMAGRLLSDIGWGTVTIPPIVVTTLADEDDGFLGGGAGMSLREAIKYSVSGDIVTFGVKGTVTLSLGQLVIDHNLTIQGTAAETLLVNANSASRAILVNAGVTADISNIDVANGSTSGAGTQGANIRNQGTLHLSYGTISGGSTTADGGALYNTGTLTVDHCLFLNNHADFDGGAVRIDAGTCTFDDCTFTGGTTGFSGAGLRSAGGTTTLRCCTITRNTANLNGGGLQGGFIVQNTLVSGNGAGSTGPDIAGPFTSLGFNLVGDASGASGFVGTDKPGVFQALGALGSFGGRTAVFPLGNGPAINAIPSGSCVLIDDQRGTARPQNGACDIGAFEQTIVTGVGGPLAFTLRIAPEANPATRERLGLRFTLPAAGRARVELFDVTGRRVAVRDAGVLAAGEHRVDLAAGATLAPGVYLARLSQGGSVATARVSVLD
jgi:CSLREA domain-containing protein